MAAPDRQRLTRRGFGQDYQQKRFYAAQTVGEDHLARFDVIDQFLGPILPPMLFPESRAGIAQISHDVPNEVERLMIFTGTFCIIF